jgi:GTPase SAR1 family protein
MGLLRVLRKLKLKEKEMWILFLGLDNAGKSSVIKAFMGESIDDLSPTLGFEIKTVECQGYRLSCWDVRGSNDNSRVLEKLFRSDRRGRMGRRFDGSRAACTL